MYVVNILSLLRGNLLGLGLNVVIYGVKSFEYRC